MPTLSYGEITLDVQVNNKRNKSYVFDILLSNFTALKNENNENAHVWNQKQGNQITLISRMRIFILV